MDKKLRLIIKVLIIIAIIVGVIGVITWQIYSYVASQNSLIISDPVKGSETIMKSSPGGPLKNATTEIKENISTIS